MKIIVTGGSGFVGSNTIVALVKKGYEVLNFDLTEGFDIRKLSDLQEVIEPGDKVLHLAAIARFAQADADPLLAYETNIEGTKNVALACLAKKAERLVYSSTGSVYMPVEQEPPISEEFKCRGNSVYACSKYIGELILERLKVPYVILRYAHLYGKGKIGHGAIGGFIDRMNRGLSPILYGGKQSNDFTHIEDIVQANILALETRNFGEVYNIGSGEELTTEGVFEIMRDALGYEEEFTILPGRSVDPLRFVFDISKAREGLGYNPKYSFREGFDAFCEENNIKAPKKSY